MQHYWFVNTPYTAVVAAVWCSRRRSWSFPRPWVLIALAVLCVRSPADANTLPVPTDWPMYQHGGDHIAVIDRPGFGANWTFDARSRINSGLAVVGDRVLFDTFDGKVIALDLRSGRPMWSVSTDNVLMSTPIVAQNVVYVGTGHNGTMNAHRSSFVYTTLPGRTEPDIWGRPEGDHVIALDLKTGRERWRYRTAGQDMPSGTVVDDILVFATGDFHAYGLRVKDGTALWQQDIGGLSTMASAMRSGNDVLIGICSGARYRGSTLALNPHTGRIRWRSRYGDCDSTPTVAAGNVYTSGVEGNDTSYGHGSRGVVAALDARDGHVLWSYTSNTSGPYTKVGSNERAIAGAYAHGLYFQAIPTSDEIIAFDAMRGTVKWRFRTQGPVKMSPVIYRNRLYVGDIAGLFYTMDASSGKLLHVAMFDEPFSTSPPVIVGNTVIAVNGTRVVAFRI